MPNLLSHPFTKSSLKVFLFAAPLALLSLPPSAARAQLALGLGGTSGDEGRAVAVDAVGNTFITGFFNGTVDFDPGPGTFELTATGGVEAAYVASYDPAFLR